MNTAMKNRPPKPGKMLSEEAMERLSEVLVNRIEELNAVILEEIGIAIKKIGTLTPSKAQQLVQILKYGGSYDKIMKKLAEITNLNVKQIYEIFDEVARKNQLFAKQFYEYRQLDFIPYDQNSALKQQVKAIADVTANNFLNMTKTTAFLTLDDNGNKIFTKLSEIYQTTVDKAVLNVVQGKEAYTTAMRKTMRELAQNGIRTVDYASGYSRRLDSSVRQNLLEGMRTLTNQMQENFGKEFDADGVEISVHEHPAEDHEDLQGKQYSNEEFEELNNSLERPISTLNCYHYIFSIVLGVSKPQYSEEQLKKLREDNEKGFTFEGKHFTLYEGTQLQRTIETNIRILKDRQIGARAMGDIDEVAKCQKKIRLLTSKYNDLAQVSGLRTKRDRLVVSGYRRISTN